MQVLLRIIRKNGVFFWAVNLAFIAATLFICFCTKLQGFLALNRWHSDAMDGFFSGATFLGDGLFSLLVVAAIMIFGRRFELGVQVLVAFLISGLAAQVLKNIFHAPRPMAAIAPGVYHYFIAGVTHSGLNSFPSGHSTSIFALATVLALSVSQKATQLTLLFVALLVGYSRVYLGQHFPEDVIAGAVLGVCTGLAVYCFINPVKWFYRRRSVSLTREKSGYSSFAGN